jgi:hypothetical protein
MFIRNSRFNRRIQTKATTHTGTDAAAGVGKTTFSFFVYEAIVCNFNLMQNTWRREKRKRVHNFSTFTEVENVKMRG